MQSGTAYYENFTKYIIQTNSVEKTPEVQVLFYQTWLSNRESVQDLSVVELKKILKRDRCRVSGKRSVLIQRLCDHYSSIRSTILIQKIFRGFVVRDSERLRGPANISRNCVNETDFHTMDSISEIPHECFFSYGDDNGFVYGFNVFSLMTMFRRNRKFVNPYNREDIPLKSVCRIFSLYKKIEILYPLTFQCNKLDNIGHIRVAIETAVRDAVAFDGLVIPDTFDIEAEEETTTAESNSVEIEFQEVSEVQVNDRILQLFSTMQSLIGRQINPEWFLFLRKNEYDRFYHFYYIWWSRSNYLSDEEKRDICASHDPFSILSQIDEYWTESRYRILCLDLMELMVYTGINEDNCKSGAEQVIMILSVVSKPARIGFPDLFDRLA